MSSVIYLTVLFVGSTLGSPIANQYIDSVLNTALRTQIRSLNLDPAAVSNFNTSFEDKVAIIGKVKGQADFTHGVMTGLLDVRRFSECGGPSFSFGVKKINCTIAFPNLNIEYEGKLKYGKMPKVSIKGKANVTNTVVFMSVEGQQFAPALKDFLFTKFGQLSIKFSGLGPLNKFTKFLENGFKSHVEAEIFNSMSQRFQFALSRAVASVPMPN